MKKLRKRIMVLMLKKKLNLSLPRSPLKLIYKSFIRPLVDYDDIIYDQSNSASFSDKIKSIKKKKNAVLAISEAIKGSLKEKLY